MEQEITEVTEKESNEFIGLLCRANLRFLCDLLLENLRVVRSFLPFVAQGLSYFSPSKGQLNRTHQQHHCGTGFRDGEIDVVRSTGC